MTTVRRASLPSELALGKTLAVTLRQHPEAIVIGSDSIVTIEDRQLEKPHDAVEAKRNAVAAACR